jgi:hypothetical protein
VRAIDSDGAGERRHLAARADDRSDVSVIVAVASRYSHVQVHPITGITVYCSR